MTTSIHRAMIAASLLGTASPIALAQDRLETVIVTAPGANRTADELIGNATAMPRDEILRDLAGSLGDTLDSQPGVATTFFGAGASRPVLRGLGAERVLVLTNGIGVIDVSAASPDHQLATDGLDADSIEILRGPAALAYGGQAIGGVVNVIDGLIVETLPDTPAYADLFGAWNSVNSGTELAGRSQFVAGPFVFTLSASDRNFDDYDIPGFVESSALRTLEAAENPGAEPEEDSGSVENSFVETQTLAGGVSWIGERATFGVAVRQQESTYGLPGSGHHGHDEGEPGEPEELPFIDLEQTRIDIRANYKFDSDLLTDLSATFASGDYEHVEFEAPGEPGTRFTSEGTEGRLELGHRLGDFNGAIGLQYVDKEIAAFGDEAFITPTSTESYAVFIYESRDWGEESGIEGGARFETVSLDNIFAGKREFDLVSGSFGAHVHWLENWFLGAQVSLTERAPNESELFANGPHLATNQYEIGSTDLGEESALNLEATARWSNDTVSIGLNVFTTDFSDFIYLTPSQVFENGVLVSEVDELPVFQFVQEDARFHGGELYAEMYFDDGLLAADWQVKASLDYVNAELDSGANVPFIPPLSLNLDTDASWGPWQLGARLTVADKQNDPGTGQLPTDGFTALDLRGEVDLSSFGVGADGTALFLEARNVTDEEIRHATSVLKDLLPAPGRNVRVGLRLAF